MVDLREATVADAKAMARIQVDWLREHATDEYDEEQLEHLAPNDLSADDVEAAVFDREDGHAVVAQEASQVVGFGVLHVDDGALAGVYVEPEFVDEGIGETLVGELEAHAREMGLSSLWVPAPLTLVAFYEGFGYESGEEIDLSVDDSVAVPGVRMEKSL